MGGKHPGIKTFDYIQQLVLVGSWRNNKHAIYMQADMCSDEDIRLHPTTRVCKVAGFLVSVKLQDSSCL